MQILNNYVKLTPNQLAVDPPLVYIALISGPGRRCRRVGNARASYFKEPTSSLLHHVKRLLWGKKDQRISIWTPTALSDNVSCLHWMWHGFCNRWPWENQPISQILFRGHRWVLGHIPWHRSHKGVSDSSWYYGFPVHLQTTRYQIVWKSVQHLLKERGSRSNQTRKSTANTGFCCTAFTPSLPADPGLDPSTEHVSEPNWLRLDIRCAWVWTSPNTRPHGSWGAAEVHKL